MLKSYLKIALRNLQRHKGYAAINVTGLAVGMAVCLLILLFVRHELSYDRFHDKADRIYRVLIEEERASNVSMSAHIPEPVAPGLQEMFPEVQAAVRVDPPYGEMLIRAGDRQFYETSFLTAGPQFFEVFSFEPVAGDLRTALAEPGSIVLTETAARKYFNGIDPVGQVLTVEKYHGPVTYTVRAVIASVPSTSHLQFDFVAYREEQDQPRWNYYTTNGYILLRADANVDAFRAKLPDFVRRNAYYDHERDVLPALRLQPLTAIHLHPEWGQETTGLGPIAYLYLFSGVALLILLIACINFMNLATARSARRAREVGVRKTVGAGRGQLIMQFLGESVLMSLLALALALMLVELLLPAFSAIIGQPLTFSYSAHPELLLVLVGLAVGAGLISGSYPALFLSSFRPTWVLKGTSVSRNAGAGFRKALVIFQFAASIVLILASAVIYRQMEFIRTTRLNAHDAQVLVVKQGQVLGDRFSAFKQALLADPTIASVSAGQVPGSISGWATYPDSSGSVQRIGFVGVGENYLETLGLDLIAGRDFNALDDSGQSGVVVGGEQTDRKLIVNKTAVDVLLPGVDDPVGQFVQRINGTVIGVVQDFHMLPMHEAIEPLVFQFTPRRAPTILVRLKAGQIAEGLAHVRTAWQRLVPERPLLYAFLDDELDEAYRAELRLGRIFGAFSLLAVLIACLGLFGLAAFTAEQRTKEIGIRKVLGASVTGLMALLSKDFLKLVAYAFIVAVPASYFAMSKWLEDFAYRIEISWSIFLMAGLAALGVALLTVSWQAMRAALADPVDSLRYE